MNIKEQLVDLPNQIRDCRIDLLECELDLEQKKEWLEKWKLDAIDLISNTVDANGKPVFSNETKRNIELSQMKRASEEYEDMQSLYSTLNKEYKLKTIELNHLLDIQSNLKALCRLGSED